MELLRNEEGQRGAVTIVEASFVFPIMFFVIFILIMAGEAYYQHSRVEYEVVRAAISGAARCENPMQEYVQNHGNLLPEGPNDTSVLPYRYIFTGEAESIASKVASELKHTVDSMKPLAFRAMSPVNTRVKVKPKMNILVSSVQAVCEFDIELPIKMLLSGKKMKFHFTVSTTAPVGDPSEFVRNVALVKDILDRYDGAQKMFSELKSALDNIGKYTN